MMPAVRIIAIFCLLLLSACAGVREPPGAAAQAEPPHAAPPQSAQIVPKSIEPEPSRSEAVKETAAAAPPAAAPPPSSIHDEAVANAPAAAAAPAPQSHGTAKPAAQVKAPAKPAVAPTAIEPPRTHQDPPASAKPAPLNVAELKARLRDTKAIGVFTKLALKNQVDDLLEQFRAHYLNGPKTSVAALRQPFDMLILKVLALIQDSDPALAKTISGSREAIWGILADPEKFNSAS